MFIDETSSFYSNELQGSESRRPALPSRQAMVKPYRALQNDGDVCYPCYLPRLMTETAAPHYSNPFGGVLLCQLPGP
jgi:hypothetical protein